jgi:hypothetical protein
VGSTATSALDLYLAAMMRASQDLMARLQNAGVDLEVAQRVVSHAERAVFADPHGVRPAKIVEFFGPPSRSYPFSISYDLVLWPEHRYDWHVDDGGRVSHGEFILRCEEVLPKWLPKELEPARSIFRPMHHTATDVERVFGEPDADESWFPQQKWHYGPLRDGRDLVFDFDLGLLREVGLARSVPRDNRGVE